ISNRSSAAGSGCDSMFAIAMRASKIRANGGLTYKVGPTRVLTRVGPVLCLGLALLVRCRRPHRRPVPHNSHAVGIDRRHLILLEFQRSAGLVIETALRSWPF